MRKVIVTIYYVCIDIKKITDLKMINKITVEKDNNLNHQDTKEEKIV